MFALFFCLCSLLLLVYLVTRSRVIDVFLLAAGSAFLFTLPMFLGIKLTGPPGWPSVDIEPELYVAFGTLFLMLLVAVVLYDYTSIRIYNRPAPAVPRRRDEICFFMGVMWSGIFAIMLSKYGFDRLFGGSKRSFIDQAGFLVPLYTWLSTLLSVWVFYYGKKFGKLFALAVLSICLLMGFRAPLVVSGLALVMLYGRDFGRVALIHRYPLSVPILVISSVVFISMAKPFYAYFRVGGLQGVVEGFSQRGFVDIAGSGMEFMRTQYIFNTIVLKEFSTDGGHIARGVLSFIPYPRSLYTTPSSEFNDLYQPVLFPGHPSGMAYNPFGEFYAAFGMLGVITFNLILVSLVFVCGLLIRRGGSWSVFWAIVGVLIAFYFHRNSVAVTFGFIRNIFWPFLLCWMAASTLTIFTVRRRN